MNQDIAVLREVVVKVTQMLSGMGLRVTQIGAQAYVKTDPRTHKPVVVNIPNIPDNASEDFIFAIQGFIDHEVAHVLFNDWGATGACRDFPAKRGITGKQAVDLAFSRIDSLHNIVEDVFIERKMGEKFPGTPHNLNKLHTFFVDKITQKGLNALKGNPIDEFAVLIVPIARAWGGQRVFKEFMDNGGWWDHPLVKAFDDRVPDDIKARFPKLKDSWDCLEVAEVLFDILYPPPPPAPPQSQPQPGESGDTSDSDEKSDEKQDGKGSNQSKPEDDEDQGSGGESDDQQKSEEEQDGKNSSKDNDPSDDDADEETEQPGSEGEGGDEDEAEADDAEGDSEDQGDGAADEQSDEEDQSGSGREDDDSDETEENEPGSEGDDREGDDEADGASDDQGASGDDADGDEDGDDEDDDRDQGDADEDREADDGDGDGANGSDGDEGDQEDQDAGDGEEGDVGSEGDPDDGNADLESGSGTDGEDGESEDDRQGQGELDEEDTVTGAESTPSPFETGEVDIRDFDSSLSLIITDEATRATRGADYTVYTRDFDRIEKVTLPQQYKDEWLVKLDETVQHMVGPMQKEIERIMAARSQIIRVAGQRRGRLHGPSLHRIRAGDDRVFSKTWENTSKDTAVYLKIDNSGSMGGGFSRGRMSKMTTAMAAGYALSQTLERVGIAHQVSGFTTQGIPYNRKTKAGSIDIDDVAREQQRIGRPFSRVEPLYLPIYKAFEERLTPEVKKRFAVGAYEGIPMGANVDGESVEFALRELAKRREARKVILVLSDGQPATSPGVPGEIYSHVHKVVADAEKMKIEIIGIGIQSTAVQSFYPKNMVLNRVEELPAIVMGELKKILTAA